VSSEFRPIADAQFGHAFAHRLAIAEVAEKLPLVVCAGLSHEQECCIPSASSSSKSLQSRARKTI
jgi:hypothetical protein